MRLLSCAIAAAVAGTVASYRYEEHYFTQTLDHFDFFNQQTFQQQYLVNDTWWRKPGSPGGPGPIFFYTGNEGPIGLFANNTGLMWDLAPEFNALLVFGEHRYFGKSLPFGNKTYEDPKSGRLGYLSSEQALADYAALITYLKEQWNAKDAPVVSFGGSYGGMLAAWSRMKYPSVFNGAIAGSAPIWQFTNLTDAKDWNHVLTRTFQNANENCASGIASSWEIMQHLGQSQNGLSFLRKSLGLCQNLTSASNVTGPVFQWLNGAISYMAMADYPYPASFLGPMPAWPVDYGCSKFSKDGVRSTGELLAALRFLANTFYNYTGQAGDCFDLGLNSPSTLGGLGGWDYLSCTEMVMPEGQYGPPNDMLWYDPWNYTAIADQCYNNYGLYPRPDWIATHYDGKNLQPYSNIVFSNGYLDPWISGGVTTNVTGNPSVIALVMPDGAHHLDLRSSNPDDPASVIEVRNVERMHIRKWCGMEQIE